MKSAQNLHREALVFDYYPLGIPLPRDEEIHRAVTAKIGPGVNGNALVFEIFDRALTIIEGTDEKAAAAMRGSMENAIAESGVNGTALTLGNISKSLSDYNGVLESIEWWHRMVDALPSLRQVRSADEIEKAAADGACGLLFVLQDGGAVEELARIAELYRLGVRIIQLTYNRANGLGAGCAEDPSKGLTELGREAIARMKRQGIAVDFSHCNRQTTLEGIAACAQRKAADKNEAAAPPAITHSSCKAVYGHFRGKSDEELRALADADGYFGLYLMPGFLTNDEGPDGSGPDFDIFLRHLEHAVKVLGPERVGIGSDWGLWSPDVPPELSQSMEEAALKMGFTREMGIAAGLSVGGMKDYREWPLITEALVEAGRWSEDKIHGFLGKNFLAYLRRVEAAAG
jgi:membrane dipeptidase